DFQELLDEIGLVGVQVAHHREPIGIEDRRIIVGIANPIEGLVSVRLSHDPVSLLATKVQSSPMPTTVPTPAHTKTPANRHTGHCQLAQQRHCGTGITAHGTGNDELVTWRSAATTDSLRASSFGYCA